jgi:glycosyltransferase involved in cell wall biosynthesis
MNICIDARWIFPELSGIGLYTQELLRALAEVDRVNEYLLLFSDDRVMERTTALLPPNAGFRSRVSRLGLFSPKNQLLLPGLLRREKVDLYHSTNYMMPLLGMGRIRRFVTIHDLIPLMFRDHAPEARKEKLFPIYKGLMHRIARKADVILTVSESTKRDIVRELNVNAAKIAVTPEGVGPEYHPTDRRSPVTGHQILYVGRRDPYKNLPLLIEAFSDVVKNVPAARLRIIGPADDRYPAAPDLARKLGLEPQIDWIGYVSPRDLVQAYQDAAVYVLPSRYEGFGLTVLEAMACGAPVVCSNASSLPEVAGDAALLVPPGDRVALADALTRVLTDAQLAQALREKGVARAASFTWRRTAELTVEAYRRA